MPPRRKILLVDDHPVMRDGLAFLLEREKDFVVCGQAGTLAEAWKVIEACVPHVIATDLTLPDGLIGLGCSATTIAERLGISRRTVNAHRWNMRGRLGLGKGESLVRYAVKWIENRDVSA